MSLTRRVGESIVVAHDVVIRVEECGRGRVRLVVDAPSEIPVNRAEIETRDFPAGTGRRGRFVPIQSEATLPASA